MGINLRKYTPVAADLPAGHAFAAKRSAASTKDCLDEIGSYLGIHHPFPVSSGRAALYAILKSMLAPGSKVILPGYTCYTVAAAVIRAGMIPVISDSRETDFGYDLDKLRETIMQNPDTKAIVICHMFGIALDFEEIKNVVGPEVLIIDDAAQAFGIKSGDKFLGTMGEAGFYSFGRGKNLSLVGGGLLVTDNDNIAAKVEALITREFLPANNSTVEFVKAVSYNLVTRPFIFNMVSRAPGMRLGRSEFNPGFNVSGLSDYKIGLLHQLHASTEALNNARKEVSHRYFELLDGNQSVSIPKSRINNEPGSLRFPVLVKDTEKRDEILAGAGRGWGLSAMYPTALNRIQQAPQLAKYNLETAEYIAQSIVTLPTHRHIQLADKKGRLTKKIAGLFA